MTQDKDDYLPGDEVAVGCPLCGWESHRIVVGGAPNAAWRCYDRLATEYREHFDRTHRPLFTRLHFPAGRAS